MSVAEPAASRLETAAAARLYERHSSRVFGYCLRMLGSREDAEDASQTTFMQAHRALQRGVVPAFETAWLLTIAKNVCHARHRTAGRRKAVELVRDPQDLEELAVGPERDGSLMGLPEALGRLPEQQRRAFLLREWQGCSYAEIADELEVTIPAVEMLIFRARRTLAADLRGDSTRRHAFDLASVAAALKSLLGGGAAVKVAVGAATVVTAGAVVGSTALPSGDSNRVRRSESPAPVEQTASVVPAAGQQVRDSIAVNAPEAPVASDSGALAPKPATRGSEPTVPPEQATPAAPSVPSAPDVPPATPEPPTAEGPSAPAPAVPPPPSVPEAPAVPPLPVEVPPLPTDQLPVELPTLPPPPEIPGVPEVPGLPNVAELPAVPDLPDVPGLPLP